MKKLLAVLSCLALTAATPAVAREPYDFDPSAVLRITCKGGVGTGFHIGNGKYVTALHVVQRCKDEIPNLYVDVKNDFATFTGPVLPVKFTISCGRYKSGEMYVAIGYPEGGTYQAREPVVAVDYKPDGVQAFIGQMIPGMSGGPVINERGKVMGLVNLRWPARSVALRDTYLCD